MRWHHFFELWTFTQMSLQLIYLIINIFCMSFKVSTAKKVSVCTAHLSLINMMSVYFEFHLSFICNLLRVSLIMYHLFHTFTVIMSVLFELLHILIHVISKLSFKVSESWQMFKLIVSFTAFNRRSLLIILLSYCVHDLVTSSVTALISVTVIWSLSSLSSDIDCHHHLHSLKTCFFSVKAFLNLPAHLQLHICSYVHFEVFYHFVLKCHDQLWLLMSLNCEAQSHCSDDHLPHQILKSQSQTVCKCVNFIN